MTTNFWIYLSSLLVCFAIVQKLREFNVHSKLKEKQVKVDDYLRDHLRGKYSGSCYELISNCKRRRKFSSYRDSLAVVKYLVDRNDVEALKDLWISIGVGYMEIREKELLSNDIEMYSYANDIIEIYIEETQSPDFFSTAIVDVEIKDLGEYENRIGELNFDFYHLVSHNTEVVYISDDKVLKNGLGGAISEMPLNNLEARMIDDVTGETKTYKMYGLKNN